MLLTDFVGNRLLWIDSRLATLNAYMVATSSREVLHTSHEYPRHPAGLAVFEVVLKQLASYCVLLYILREIFCVNFVSRDVSSVSGLLEASVHYYYYYYCSLLRHKVATTRENMYKLQTLHCYNVSRPIVFCCCSCCLGIVDFSVVHCLQDALPAFGLVSLITGNYICFNPYYYCNCDFFSICLTSFKVYSVPRPCWLGVRKSRLSWIKGRDKMPLNECCFSC